MEMEASLPHPSGTTPFRLFERHPSLSLTLSLRASPSSVCACVLCVAGDPLLGYFSFVSPLLGGFCTPPREERSGTSISLWKWVERFSSRQSEVTSRVDRSMDPGCSESNNHETPMSRKKPLVAMPVSAGSSGEGLPYAPEDWPGPGDVWSWKVGRRVSATGYWVDRGLRPPSRLVKDKALGSKHTFYSRVLVERFVRKEFPGADVGAFFDSFIWKIPSMDQNARRKGGRKDIATSAFGRMFPHPNLSLEPQSKISDESGGCKAGNKMCSLWSKARSDSPVVLECDICCNEAGFCHDCCCILCCTTIDWAFDGYSFIRCEGIIDKNFICGHVAHVDCALRAYMAGTVGGSIGLDAEYYCRRCDARTDLIPHVSRIIQKCQSLDSRDDIEKILELALRILHGSEQMRAKHLCKHIQLVMAKLKSGIRLRDIWGEEHGTPVVAAGAMFYQVKWLAETGSASGNGVTSLRALTGYGGGPRDTLLSEIESSVGAINGRSPDGLCINLGQEIVAIKLEEDVGRALQELRKSQESEFNLAEQKLCSKKDYLVTLYQQLDAERSELARQTSSRNKVEDDFLLADVLGRLDQITQEESRLREMMVISKGFGRASKRILKEHFQLAIDD